MRRFFPYLLIFAVNLVFLSQPTLAQTFCDPNSTIKMISVSSDGTQGGLRYEGRPSLSADGRYIAFESFGQLAPEDTDTELDIYLYDRMTCQTELISSPYSGDYEIMGYGSTPALSADGQYVAYTGNIEETSESVIILRDRSRPKAEVVSLAFDGSLGNGPSYIPSLSQDGRYIAFYSDASNMIPADVNNTSDAFVYDLVTETLSLVSIELDGDPAGGTLPTISLDGRFVAFSSASSKLIADDTNNSSDIFVSDLMTGVITRVSINSNGDESNGESFSSWISGNGRYIAFDSLATNLVPNDTNNRLDIFVYDTVNGQTTRVSVASTGEQADAQSYYYPAMSANGQLVIFRSDARNLVQNDTNVCIDSQDMTEPNACPDIFIRNLQSGETIRISEGAGNVEGNGAAWNFAISGDGRFAAFGSEASNLVPDDLNGDVDAFLVQLTFSSPQVVPGRNYFTTRTPTLSWNRVSWATGYYVQVARDANFTDLVFEKGNIPENQLSLTVISQLQNGSYYWRVRALGNLTIKWSKAELFKVNAP